MRKVHVGDLNGIRIEIHVDNGVISGADLIHKQLGVVVECQVKEGTTNEERVKGLLKGLGASVKEENYEMAAIVRDTLVALGVKPHTTEGEAIVNNNA